MGRYKNNKDGTLDLIAGAGDTSELANKTDISSIILTGTTNTSGSTITAGTWFYLNGEIVKAKVDIASNATFTLNTNYEKKTVGSALSELNGKCSEDGRYIFNGTVIDLKGYTSLQNKYTFPADGYVAYNSGETSSGRICIMIYGDSTNIGRMDQPITQKYQGDMLRVNKGMSCYVDYQTGVVQGGAYFIGFAQ